jgi:hypothetical protein
MDTAEKIQELKARIAAIDVDIDAVFEAWLKTSGIWHPIKSWKLSMEHERLCKMRTKWHNTLMAVL